MNPGLVIFDCDGVLIDSEMISVRVTTATLRDAGLEIDEDEVARRFLGLSDISLIASVEKQLGRPLGAGFSHALVARTLAAFEDDLRAMPGVEAAIRALSCKFCVASSSAPSRLARSLELTGLADLFGADVFSARMVACGKPAPDLFLHAAATMGVAPGDCLVIEDSAPGVIAAGRAGMRVFGFCGGSHLRGAAPVAALAAAGAHLVFDDMTRLAGLIDLA